MNAAHQRRLSPWLGGIAATLGVVLLLLLGGLGRHAHWGKSRALAPLPPVGSAADLPRALPLQQFMLVWQKPLFNPDRKPTALAADGGSDLGDLQLTGIILTPRMRMALLHDKNGDREIRLREGETLQGSNVTLVEVHPRSALFDSAAGRTELKLPAGAPIDPLKSGADTKAAPAGDATMRVQQDAPGRRPPALRARQPGTQPQLDHPQESALERIRRSIQQRRAARAAAAHEGVR